MIVYGWEVPNKIIEACEAGMVDRFVCFDIESIARHHGVSDKETAMRIADRLIQKNRKAGRIHFNGRAWRVMASG